MDLIYKSTRNNQETATASEAILKGLAGEGGLFVPSYIPKLDKSLKELSAMSYQEVAYEVMKLFMTDFTEEAAQTVLNEGGYSAASVNACQEAKDASGTVLGYVLTVTTHEGYGGDIQFTVGVRNDGTLNGISLLSISETAGLGMQAGDVLVPQFADKNAYPYVYTKTGSTADNEIDAISGATITTNAVTDGVNAGVYYFQTMLQQGAGEGAANE